ncbi:MAG: hypothetical protein ACRCYV_10515 [Aeromonas sp.]
MFRAVAMGNKKSAHGYRGIDLTHRDELNADWSYPMAVEIKLEHPETGEVITGLYGFSWTTLIFGAFPALFRKDFVTFIGFLVILILLSLLTVGFGTLVAMIAWAFMYNKYYTVNKIKQGYKLAGSHEENLLAAEKLGLLLNERNCKTAMA